MRSPKPADNADHRHPAVAGRRKGSSARLWLVVAADGDSKLEEVGRQSIMRRTGLPARDLRVLDPAFSYPSTILGRERAIVINLEHIKAIITATEVLVAHSKDPLVVPFVQDLQSRVSGSGGGGNQEAAEAGDMDGVALNKKPSFSAPGARNGPGGTFDAGGLEGGVFMPVMNIGGNEKTKVVPFEFRALEICLESTCKCLEQETTNLEHEAYPALDELTSKISTLNLERVRQIKSRLVAISGRVQKVRDELEHLLDDDMDMAEMYLTEKLQQRFGESSSRVYSAHNASENGEGEEDIGSEAESSIHESLGAQKPNVEELEMLLEAYFVQIDGTLNKLSHLREYVDDTEDYINIMLDEKQNQLLQMGVMLSTATVVATAGVVVVSLFGMNITIDLYNITTFDKFWETTFGTITGCVVLYVLAIGLGKKKGLLQ